MKLLYIFSKKRFDEDVSVISSRI